VNVTVVGGGIIGCAVGRELASRGARVRIIDMRGTGRGATQASAGILAPYIEGHIDALLRLGVNSLALYEGFIARVSEDAQQTIEYERFIGQRICDTDRQVARQQVVDHLPDHFRSPPASQQRRFALVEAS